MITFFKNIKEAKLLDKKIQEDRSELQLVRNNLITYFDRNPYELISLLIGSFSLGLVSSFFLETIQLIKIVTSPYINTFRTFLHYIPLGI